MKYNYRLYLQYDGTRYNGWQKQGNTNCTIQGILEEKITLWIGETIEIKGSGRTDRGVHAAGQVANFHSTKVIDTKEMKKYLNTVLEADIHVDIVDCVPMEFHSRKSAVGKTYEYCIWNGKEKNVFYPNYAFTVEKKLDIDIIKQAAEYLVGTHDFLGFSSLKNSKKSTIRTITDITIKKQNNRVFIQYTGNGFLYHMVRILTGTLIEIGKGSMRPEIVLDILEKRERQLAGPTVPAQGLKLVKVFYDE